MRKETDYFDCQMDGADYISAHVDSMGVFIKSFNSVNLTKQQARKFARQMLEMTGDEDESLR